MNEAEAQAAVVDPGDELAHVRGIADAWLKGVTTLFGLFSFTGIFFGGEALTDLSGTPLGFFVSAAVVGVIGTASAIFFGTRAAHGWPERESKRNTKKERAFRSKDENVRKRVKNARDDLYWTVASALVSLVAVAVAVGAVWWSQVAKGPPTTTAVVRIFDAESESVLCGPLQRITESSVWVRNDNNEDIKFDLDTHTMRGASCP